MQCRFHAFLTVKARNLSPVESFVKSAVWRDQNVAAEASRAAAKRCADVWKFGSGGFCLIFNRFDLKIVRLYVTAFVCGRGGIMNKLNLLPAPSAYSHYRVHQEGGYSVVRGSPPKLCHEAAGLSSRFLSSLLTHQCTSCSRSSGFSGKPAI